MEMRIQLKKSKIFTTICVLALWSLSSTLAKAQTSNKQGLPVFHNVGVLPLQVDSSRMSTRGLELVIKTFDRSFSKAVRESGRFDVLEDELIASFWKSPTERRTLVQDYDVSAFLSLTLVPSEDAHLLIARILNTDLNILLQETDNLASTAIHDDDVSAIAPKVRELCFRLFNRLPVDISVRSIQGKYITLSGGTQQGLSIGEELNLVRPIVHSTNPANNAWTDFESPLIGHAKIIEVKETTSIGEITQLLRPNDIKIGDGARSDRIASRIFFKENTLPPGLPASVQQAVAVSETPPKMTTPPPIKPKVVESSKTPTPPEEVFLSKQFRFVGQYARKVSEGFSLYVGQEGWYYNGPSSTQSKLRYYIPLNMLGFDFTGRIADQVLYSYGLSLSYDTTKRNGTYSAYDLHFRAYWEEPFPIFQDVARFNWSYGVEPALVGLRVNHEQFGGYDLFELRPFIGVNGSLEPLLPYRWLSEFSFIPYENGKIGYQGKLRRVSAAWGWRTTAGVFYAPAPKGVQIGASFTYGRTKLTDSKSIHEEFSHYMMKFHLSEQF